MSRSLLCVFVAFLSGSAGCELVPELDGEPVEGTIHLWVGSDKDAYVSCGRTGACEEQNLTFGSHGEVVVSHNGVGHKSTYLHFMFPYVPDGTIVERAYLELYHPARNGDGTSDDVLIPVTYAVDEFDPHTLNWTNQPNSVPSSELFRIDLESQSWSGSPDISDIVQDILDDPDAHHGFFVWWDQLLGGGIEKSFYSNNDIRRRVDDLGLAPRVVIRLTLPEGTSTADMFLPPFPVDHDLDRFDGREVLMVQVASGSDEWPSDWDVTGP